MKEKHWAFLFGVVAACSMPVGMLLIGMDMKDAIPLLFLQVVFFGLSIYGIVRWTAARRQEPGENR